MPPASGEYSNRAVARAGGVTVIVLDRLNTSFEDQKLARDQIIEFLKDVRPEDRIALYVLQSGSVEILHDFTRDNASLIAALARYLRAGLLPSARRWDGAYHAIRVMLTRGGASVRSRKRYYATPLEAPDAATSQKALLTRCAARSRRSTASASTA